MFNKSIYFCFYKQVIKNLKDCYFGNELQIEWISYFQSSINSIVDDFDFG